MAALAGLAGSCLGQKLAITPTVSSRRRSATTTIRGRASRLACRAALSLDKEDPSSVSLVDHYRRLGVSPDATNAEIVKAFEARCRELTDAGTDQVLDEEAARQRLQDLEASLDVLTSEEARRLYDWGLQRAQRGETDVYVWPFETDLTQKNYTPGIGNPPRPMTPIDDEGIAALGTFALAWFIISIVLSCTLK